jgi:MarR family transcriptional regulator for hemolysin
MLDLQPISLTRLLDGLAENGLIERRADPADRRAKRLFLTPAARPLLDHLSVVAEDLMGSALAGLDENDQEMLLKLLATVKENLRQVIQKRQEKQASLEQRYG